MTQTPSKSASRQAVMLAAADLIEQDALYSFGHVNIPQSCKDTGCALGWTAHVLNIDLGVVYGDSALCRAARHIGYRSPGDFYRAMDRLEGRPFGRWRSDPETAAASMRKLAAQIP